MPKSTPATGMSVDSIFKNLTYRAFVDVANDHVSEGLLLVFIWLTLMLIAVTFIYQVCKRPQFGPLTHLFLRVCSETDEVIILWDQLTFAPGTYRIKHTKPLGRIHLDRLKLHFTTRVRFIEKDTDHETKIAAFRYITPWQVKSIIKIVSRGTYTMTLIVSNNARTVTQLIHEKIVNHTTRWDALPTSGGRITTHWTPQPQSQAQVEQEVVELRTNTTETQTDRIVPQLPPRITQPPIVGIGRGGRGAVIRHLLDSWEGSRGNNQVGVSR